MCECHFCGKLATDEEAIAAGWEPMFWLSDDSTGDECCPECTAKYLTVDETGEMVLKLSVELERT